MVKPRVLKRTPKGPKKTNATTEASPAVISPSLSMAKALPTTPEQITRLQSTNVIKNMIRVSVSEICYLRNLFPEDVFRKRVYADMHINCLAPNKDVAGTSMQDALTLTLWMEEGAFEALEKEYLEQLAFCIYGVGSDSKPTKLLESYSFKIRSTPDAVTLSTNFLGGELVSSKPDKVKEQAIQLIRSLVSITNSLDALPGNRFITMKLTYNSGSPNPRSSED
ncbi:conserved protein with N-terminal HORMA domain [Achlya hypogyna]|uniref:Conserved protein with N-terminal HORMA domain n=1 Tax=Achlya hypogyna TaxID=1202772 RepID=A0A1V9YY45_ACHHY|nr:conserved protein with N-terminal HORMA domain [Achlya hypogyna]